MPEGQKFPHLLLTHRGTYVPKFQGAGIEPDQVKKNKENSSNHASQIRTSLQKVKELDENEREARAERNLPDIPAGRSFVLRVPDSEQIDSIALALGVEIVSENNDGFILASTTDLSFDKLNNVLTLFEQGGRGGGSAAKLYDVYADFDSSRRLESILSPEVLELWPFNPSTQYTFDISITTSLGTALIKYPRVPRKRGESDADYKSKRAELRGNAEIEADQQIELAGDAAITALESIMSYYGGQITEGYSQNPSRKKTGTVFSDHIQCRLNMRGEGFTDIVLNFIKLFEVILPDDIE